MLIVFGNDSVFRPVESLITTDCVQCNDTTTWSIWKETEWASIFFIRAFPLQSRYHLGCDNCGYGLPLDKSLALEMLDPARRNQVLHDRVVDIIRENQTLYKARHSIKLPKK